MSFSVRRLEIPSPPQRQRCELFLAVKMDRFFGRGSRETFEAVGKIRILTNPAAQNASQRYSNGEQVADRPDKGFPGCFCRLKISTVCPRGRG